MANKISTPQLALDWGLNNSLGGLLNTILNIIEGVLQPLLSILGLIGSAFGGGE